VPTIKPDALAADRLISEIEEALELAFLSKETRSLTTRVVGLAAAVLAAVGGVLATVWVFTNRGVGFGLLTAYALPMFVLLVMVAFERVVPTRK
jgi:hypothetical protein